MGYKYEQERARLFTDQGQRMFLRVRDHVVKLISTAGAARLDKIIEGAGCGDSFMMLACVDRLVELRELRQVTDTSVVTLDSVYVAVKP